MRLKTTLEQWQTLQAIEQAGSIQSAAVMLNKSGEFEGTFLKPKFGDASGVRGAARLARTTNY